MAALRNKRKLAAMNGENHEDRPRIILPRNRISPRIQEDYITHVSEEIEGIVKKIVSGLQQDGRSHFGRLIPAR